MASKKNLRSASLWELIADASNRESEKRFITDSSGRTLSYGDFADLAETTAAGLRLLGVGEGSRVVWQLPNWIETVVLAAALDSLGAEQCPVEEHMPPERLAEVCVNHDAALLILPDQQRDCHRYAEALQREYPDLWVLYVDKDCLPSGTPQPFQGFSPADLGTWRFCSQENGRLAWNEFSNASLLSSAKSLCSGMSDWPQSGIPLTFNAAHCAAISSLSAIVMAGRQCLLIG